MLPHAVQLYFRFPLSLRLVEKMLLERGIVVSYETIRVWAMKFGSEYARRLKRKAPTAATFVSVFWKRPIVRPLFLERWTLRPTA